MKDPEIKPTLARPMTNSHLPGISSFPLALAGTPDAKQSFRSIQKFNMYKPALQPCRASIAFSQVHIRALLGIKNTKILDALQKAFAKAIHSTQPWI